MARMSLPVHPLARVAIWTLAAAALIIACVFGGGYLNRIRGGYKHVGNPWGNGLLMHDGVGRIIFAFPTAAVFAVATRRAHGMVLGPVFGVLLFFSLMVGWGTYMDIGRNAAGEAGSRAGVFDWALGRTGTDWDFTRRWVRTFVGMSLRGLLQSAAGGLLLFWYGYGWLYAASGLGMGLVYEVGHAVHYESPNFGQGTALGELLWGTWTWFFLFLVAFSFRKDEAHRPRRWWLPLLHHPSLLTRGHYILCHTLVGAMDVFYLVSFAWYATLHQDDMRNMHQSLMGLGINTFALIMLHAAMAYGHYTTPRPAAQNEHDALRDRASMDDPLLLRPHHNADSGNLTATTPTNAMLEMPTTRKEKLLWFLTQPLVEGNEPWGLIHAALNATMAVAVAAFIPLFLYACLSNTGSARSP